MRIRCLGCGEWHDISQTGMAIVIAAFQDGDLTKVTKTETSGFALSAQCMLVAFDDNERIHQFRQRYKGNQIKADGARF